MKRLKSLAVLGQKVKNARLVGQGKCAKSGKDHPCWAAAYSTETRPALRLESMAWSISVIVRSALVTIGGQNVLLTADAINRASEPAEGFPDADDPILAAKSAAKLLALARKTGAEVIYGHEPAQAAALGGRTWR